LFAKTLMGFFRRSIEKCGNHRRKTAKIEICTPLKSEIYFGLVSETIGVNPTTFPSRKQNLVKI